MLAREFDQADFDDGFLVKLFGIQKQLFHVCECSMHAHHARNCVLLYHKVGSRIPFALRCSVTHMTEVYVDILQGSRTTSQCTVSVIAFWCFTNVASFDTLCAHDVTLPPR